MLKMGLESSAYIFGNNYVEGMRKIKKHGYDCMDFSDFTPPDSILYSLEKNEFDNYFKEFKRAADSEGIEVWQMHGIWPHDDSTEYLREQTALHDEKAIRAAGILGCKYFVIHPALPYGWGVEPSVQDAKRLTETRILRLLPVAKREGVVICLENIPLPEGHSFSKIKDTLDIVSKINDENVKICFDTGHCNAVGENLYDAIKMLGDYIACLHVHDDVRRQDRHLIPYQGSINWSDVIKGLKEIGFNGCVSLETFINPRVPEPMKEQMQLALAGIARYIATEIEK